MELEILCPYCKQPALKEASLIRRASKVKAPLYCSRVCSGLARRTHKPKAIKVEEKRLYDESYRERNRQALKVKKAAYFQRVYDPVKAAALRKPRMAEHIEYCRQPKYKQYKQSYDAQYRAKKFYGEFLEAALLAIELENECLERMEKYDIRLIAGTLNKALQRRRQDEATNRRESERRALGHPQADQG